VYQEDGATLLDEQAIRARGVRDMSMETLTRRDHAILRAVAGGRAELVYGAEPDLLLDGRCCCDQMAAHRLARAGFIAPAIAAGVGQRVAACLTPAGTALLSA
jgi:hypothetical protein